MDRVIDIWIFGWKDRLIVRWKDRWIVGWIDR